eukprot:5487-Rhodomonas_salina.2
MAMSGSLEWQRQVQCCAALTGTASFEPPGSAGRSSLFGHYSSSGAMSFRHARALRAALEFDLDFGASLS